MLFEMPDRDPEKAKQAKRRWYLKHRERIAKQKREQRAAQKKLKPPKPPKPPPTPEEIARARELNRLACNRYRATHSAQVRALNRDYYHRHRDRIVQQQRDRRARVDSQSFPKVTCVGGRVCCPIVRAGSWIRQDRASPGQSGTLKKTNNNKNGIGSASTRP